MLQNWGLAAAALCLLALATVAGQWLRKHDSAALDRRTVDAFNARVQAWWFFSLLMACGFFSPALTIALFGLLSFWALREFVTLTPTRIGDHRALFWVFFFFTPMQFVLVATDDYGLFSVLIPVYAFLFIAARSALSGDYDRFLERIAKVQCGLMLCVYCLSFAPALLNLRCLGAEQGAARARLLFFFVTIVLFADLLQWVWSAFYRQHPIAESIDANRSWEGVALGSACAGVLGAALVWATPFPHWYQAAAMSILISLTAAAGSMTMAAVKRDRGELVSGIFVEGHGGVLSRIDAICFAAPVFYHVTRYFFGSPTS
jgi:phosphatidate cytidylyltransferase